VYNSLTVFRKFYKAVAIGLMVGSFSGAAVVSADVAELPTNLQTLGATTSSGSTNAILYGWLYWPGKQTVDYRFEYASRDQWNKLGEKALVATDWVMVNSVRKTETKTETKPGFLTEVDRQFTDTGVLLMFQIVKDLTPSTEYVFRVHIHDQKGREYVSGIRQHGVDRTTNPVATDVLDCKACSFKTN